MKTRFLALVAYSVIWASSAHCQSTPVAWPQFRGNNSSGIGTGSPPIHFGPGTNELWSKPLAPGHSSPCISGERIFVTTYDEDAVALGVTCLDRRDGEVLWQSTIAAKELEKGHPSFNPASSSPCCDDECVIAYFGSYGLLCFDLQGNRLWEKRLPLTKSYAGNATSPIIVGDKVVLYRGNYVDHYLLCLDKNTGDELWRVPHSEKFTSEMACTACPIMAGDRLICHTARSVRAFDVASGELLWIAGCATTATSTPILVGDEVIVAAWNKMGEPDLRPPFPSFEEMTESHDQDGDLLIGKGEFPRPWIFHRPEGAEAPQNGARVSFKRADQNGNGKIEKAEWARTTKELDEFRAGYDSHGVLAIPLDSQGLVTASRVRTLSTKGVPEVPSPVSDGEHIYLVKNGGLVTCLDAATGETVYRKRTRGTGTHYASPLVADGHLYTFAGDGRVSVLQLGDSPRIVAVNEMEEGVYATPAIVDGVIYLRTHSALHAFGASASVQRPGH